MTDYAKQRQDGAHLVGPEGLQREFEGLSELHGPAFLTRAKIGSWFPVLLPPLFSKGPRKDGTPRIFGASRQILPVYSICGNRKTPGGYSYGRNTERSSRVSVSPCRARQAHLHCAAGLPLNLIRGNARDGSWVGWKQGASRANLLTLRQKDHQGRLYRPELPKPFSARAESSRSSTWATAPVRTGTGIIWAIFSPAFSSTAASPRLVMSTRISPR